jgi:hypothetical protein
VAQRLLGVRRTVDGDQELWNHDDSFASSVSCERAHAAVAAVVVITASVQVEYRSS